MMTHRSKPDRRTPEGTVGGVLDTIADAVTFVIQRPWLMIVPLVVDLILWLALRVSMAPLVNSMVRVLEVSGAEGYEQAIQTIREASDQVMVSDYLGAFVPSLFAGMPLDSIMGGLTMLFTTDGFGVLRSSIYESWQDGFVATRVPSSAGLVLGIWVLSLVGSTLALVLFRVPMAREIRGTATEPLAQELFKSWGRILLYCLVLLVIGFISLFPLTLLTMLLSASGAGPGFILAVAITAFGSILGIYTYFVVDAMLIHRSGPRAGFRISYSIARQHFPQTARFVLTCIFVYLATSKVWAGLISNAPGFLVSMLGSAFVGTVLAAASMFFYTDRYRLYRAIEAGKRQPPRER